MTLIADSSSTKCDWVLLDTNGNVVFKTETLGLNPNLLTTQMLHKRLAKSEEISHIKEEVQFVYFYGAGCGTEKNKTRLKRFFNKYFKIANVEVQENILAACLAVTQDPGIVCILGTGSNACYFDGNYTQTTKPSLGYMVMDEASGNYFGKQLLRDYFYKQMPKEVEQSFEVEFDLLPHIIKANLYKHQNPNVYLANFSDFMFKSTPMHPYFKETIVKGLREFIENHILELPEPHEFPVHFVGSVAYFSRDILAEVLEEYDLTLGNVIRQPIKGLIEYFQEKGSAQLV